MPLESIVAAAAASVRALFGITLWELYPIHLTVLGLVLGSGLMLGLGIRVTVRIRVMMNVALIEAE